MKSMTLQGSVVRGRISSQIVRALMSSVARGDLQRGERLPSERELAEHYQVSQPTVREALCALEAMGLISIRHGKGSFVTGTSAPLVAVALETFVRSEPVTILEVLEIRSVLGMYSSSLVTSTATVTDLERIASVGRELRDALAYEERDPLISAVKEFQFAVSQATHNPLLYSFETFLIETILELQAVALPPDILWWRSFTADFDADRNALVEAIGNRSRVGAQEAMARYLEHMKSTFSSIPALVGKQVSEVMHI